MKPADLVITKWGARYRGVQLPCAVGRAGIGVKTGERDGITPVGIYRLCLIGVRPDRVSIETAIPQRPIGPADIWSDDPRDPDYNQWQVGRSTKFSHEALHRADPLYDLVGVLDFNWPVAKPGAGSAIFLHSWRKPRHPTEGCVAFRPDVLAWIFVNWQDEDRVIIRS